MSGAALALSAIPYFAGLDAAVLHTIGRAAIDRRYEAGEVVLLEGDPCAGLYVVEEGWLKSVKMSVAGREQIMRLVGPGQTFNEIAVLAGTPNLVTVIALEPAKVWVIEREFLVRLLEDDRRLAVVIMEKLARRVLHLMSLVEDLSLRPVEARLARLLLQNADGGEIHRRQWATQAEMASRVGTVPDVLNRALRKLADEGLIRVKRHQIQILDRANLEAKALLEL